MKIKDIARITGVSVSTVSKVINKKDAGISQQTREKVLSTVREYQYVPYSDVINKKDKSFLIGISIYNDLDGYIELIDGAQECADKYRYNIVLSKVTHERDENLKRLAILTQKNLDGLLIDYKLEETLENSNLDINHVSIDFSGKQSRQGVVGIDFELAGRLAVERLLEENHKNIAVILPNTKSIFEDSIIRGINNACFENSIKMKKNRFLKDHESLTELKYKINELFKKGITSFICLTSRVAEHMIDIMNQDSKFSSNISIIGIGKRMERKLKGKKLDWVLVSYKNLGYMCLKRLIESIEESKDLSKESAIVKPVIIYGDTIGENKNKRKILIAGSINMDVMISVDRIPMPGEVMLSKNNVSMPGGKGANQAVGAARLGADVTLIGKLGNDQEGKIIRDSLIENSVNTEGVLMDSDFGTGKAYIYVPSDGDSSLVLYGGANNRIDSEYILACESLFEKQEYCLVQTEIPLSAISTILDLAKKHGVKVILKPSAIDELSDDILKDLYMLVPNEKEINNLVKNNKSIETKTKYFIEKGVKNVIVTLGSKGCFYTNGLTKMYYDAADFKAIDTTGAADAFISGLAVYLIEGKSIDSAIRFATYCGGICVTREGVQPALPDRLSVNMYSDMYNIIKN